MSKPPRTIWFATRRTMHINCTDCTYRELDGSIGLARGHVEDNPTHLVQFATTTYSEIFKPGRKGVTDGEPTDQVRASPLQQAA